MLFLQVNIVYASSVSILGKGDKLEPVPVLGNLGRCSFPDGQTNSSSLEGHTSASLGISMALDMVLHPYNPNIWEGKVGGSQMQSPTGIHRVTLSQQPHRGAERHIPVFSALGRCRRESASGSEQAWSI